VTSAISAAGVTAPCILVGASFGGLLPVMYAGTYPADVVGLVLLEPTPQTWEKVFVDLIPEPERAVEIADLANNPERVDFLGAFKRAKALGAEDSERARAAAGRHPQYGWSSLDLAGEENGRRQ